MAAIIGGGLALGGAALNFMGGNSAADAQRQAAEQQLAFQREKLAYVQDRDKIKNRVGDEALTTYSDIFLDPTGGAQQEQIDLAMSSPLYKQMMQSQGFGEESILRSANATGGLRSGSTNLALGQYGAQLPYQALQDSYSQQLSGLSGMAGLGGANPLVTGAFDDMGDITAGGIIGANNAKNQGITNASNTLFSGVKDFYNMGGFEGWGGGGGVTTDYNPQNTPYMRPFGTGNY